MDTWILDSDGDCSPQKLSGHREKSFTPSPLKPEPMNKRSRVVIYDSDEQASPPTKRATKAKERNPVMECNSDETITTETDSEDEFIEKKKPRKRGTLPAGQKRLLDYEGKFDGNSRRAALAKDEKSTEKLERVSAADFFGSNPAAEKSNARMHSPKKKAKETKEDFSNQADKHRDVSQKVNKKLAYHDDVKKQLRMDEEKRAIKLIKAIGKVLPPSGSESKVSPPCKRPKLIKEIGNVLWVDQYKPQNIGQLVGQHGEKSPINKLLGWLKLWGTNNLGEGGKIKKPKPPPFLAQTDGSPFKAALLSGSPGIGKTTCAIMACESLGLKVVEMNASDVRSKKSLEQQITQLTESHQIEEYFTAIHHHDNGTEQLRTTNCEVKHVLIMDEVDGMSGTEDRAGVWFLIAELIQIIKETKIPIICICNDRQHPKIRSLANHCFDIRFQKPRVEQIRARMMSIACQEKLKISKEEMDQMIELSGHDIRQSIYNLQLYASAGGKRKAQKKDIAVGPFEAARKLLDSRSTLQEKQDMFFVDYGIMPLFVQENYPNMRNDKHSSKQAIAGLRRAADFISHGDTIEKCIRSSGTWKLLNEQAMLACALPSLAVDGHLRAMIQFPAWLGKNSTANKRQRLMRQLSTHTHLKLSANVYSLVVDYVPVLHDCLTKPLLEREGDGVFEVVCMMNDYYLVREDSEAVSELAVWPGKVDPSSKVLPKVKAALTRALNKEHRILPYATGDVAKGRRRAQDNYGKIFTRVTRHPVRRRAGTNDDYI
uniref:AAA domain-containing protein n=1 Tax=Angiostrongylus cantonensis TaxID=6313 RepID=A0A158PA02_ANGCA